MPNAWCRLCGEVLNGSALSLQQVPVCNRFTLRPDAVARHDLVLHQCRRCQLIQLGVPLPVEAVRPRLPWIKYREPDAHLDGVVDLLLDEPDSKAATSFGVGPFDQPLLDRLQRRGLRAAALDIRPTQSGQDGYPYLETWQLGLNAEHLTGIAKLYGTADIISCRYLLEHCHDPLGALGGLKQLLADNGVVVIEVPDSAKFLAACDYSFLWEEHVSYFVESTLRHLSTKAGYEVANLRRAQGELEDALIAVLRPARDERSVDVAPTSTPTPELFPDYIANFAPKRDLVRSWAAEAAGPSGDGLAVFGIGHQAVMFANAMGVSERIAMAVDDDPDKRSYFPPGFKVPVVPSDALLQDTKVRACLFAVAPRIEQKIRDRLAPLARRGVEFRSIFAGVPGSVLPGPSP
ncbi:MAG TPA: class I SAM-dependent methyltransferase [Bradyrhizobium sp.]|uniref:class I SAM-dependent methyltransferase n=1 Tax=Bradyrhizobium sp. TaxID=376 RepID=UPI002B81B6C8|nr:class I SAM-dependent methyltransferase [Bradyrhizobium sp.]HLZ01410.1 class I SAM-dependent methyltransferase [Bradyrhizobium sp.]